MSTISVQQRPSHLRSRITPSSKVDKQVLGTEYPHGHSYARNTGHTPNTSREK